MNIANIYRPPPPTTSIDTNYQYPLPVTLNNNNTHQQQQYHHNPAAAIVNSMNVTLPASSSSAQSIPSVSSSDYIIAGSGNGGNGSGPITTMIKSPNMISGVINPINAYNNQQHQQQSFHGSRMNLQSQSQQQQSSTTQNQSYHPYRRS